MKTMKKMEKPTKAPSAYKDMYYVSEEEYKMGKALQKKVEQETVRPLPAQRPARTKTIPDAVAERRALENQALAQDIQLKRVTLFILFTMLAIESVAIFWLAFLQATQWWGFHLEEWSFRVLIGATITQITLMIQIAVKHLFPTPPSAEDKVSEEKK